MTLPNTSTTQLEPTPVFDAQCRAVYNGWQAGDIAADDAIAQLNALAQRAHDEGVAANEGRVEHLLGNLNHYRGNLNTSIMHFERAQGFFRQLGNQRRVAMMDLNLGEVYRYKGDFTRARQLYRRAYEASGTLDLVEVRTLAISNEGLLLLHLNRHEAARAALEEGYELAQQWTDSVQSLPALLTEIHAGLTRIYLRRDDPVSAWQHALHAIGAAHNGGQHIHHGIARLAVADALTALGAVPAADADSYAADPDMHYQAAMDVFRQVRADAELAHALYAHGHSLSYRGRSLRAARQFQQAMILYTRLEMVADAARAAAAQLEVTG